MANYFYICWEAILLGINKFQTMKPLIAVISLFLFIVLASCGNRPTAQLDKINLKTTVFKNGKETLALLKNKRLDTLTVNGHLTYQITDNPTSDVLLFSYEKDMDKVEVDGGLREEVLFEIPKGDLALTFKDSDLQQTKMLFGRYCYCRGQNGIVKINDGTLNLSRKKEVLHLNLEFHSNSIPQAFDNISSK